MGMNKNIKTSHPEMVAMSDIVGLLLMTFIEATFELNTNIPMTYRKIKSYFQMIKIKTIEAEDKITKLRTIAQKEVRQKNLQNQL